MTQGNRIAPWGLAAFIVIADQLTKRLVVSGMQLHQSIPVLGDAVRLTYIHNSGLAFGVQVNIGRYLGIFSLVATIIVAFLLLRMNSEPPAQRLLFGMIMGGAIGNTIDRLSYGYVIDFIDVDLPNWLMERWPIFNIADSAVSVGVTLLIVFYLFRRKPQIDGAVNPDGTLLKSGAAEPGTNISDCNEAYIPSGKEEKGGGAGAST